GLAPLLPTAQGHPQRAMLLAHRLWEEVPPGDSATAAHWTTALERTLLEVQPELEARWQRFSVTEQKTLRAGVAGGGAPQRERGLERLDLNKSSAQQALRNLVGRAEVESAERRYVLIDPLFALWIERLSAGGEPGEPE